MLDMIMALALGAAQADAQAPQVYPGWVYEETHTIQTVDERDLIFYLDRPEAGETVPLLVLVDGSGCGGQLRGSWRSFYRPGPDRVQPYALLKVEKPGVDPYTRTPSCTEDFLRHYTIQNRVLDHMRVLQHLQAHADWWNGELLVWGWSDGGDVAAQLVSYHPGVDRAVLGAMGGGYTMAEHFEDFWACPAEAMSEAERAGCLEALRADFAEMEDNPTWRQTWSGEDNSWRVWASRLRSRLTHLLADRTQPFLIVQGAEDYDATPAQSARVLVEALEAEGNTAFEYWEIPCMTHGWGSLPRDQARALEAGMLGWLLGQNIAEDGPPRFGQSDDVSCPGREVASE